MRTVNHLMAISCFWTVFEPAAAFADIVEWPTSSGGNGHFYESVYVPEGISWLDARDLAEQRGGYLATLTSPEENAFVFQLVAGDLLYWQNGSGPLLGGYQDRTAPDYVEPAGGWRWVTGEPCSYTNWSGGGPSGFGPSGDNEDFLHFGAEGTEFDPIPTALWNDVANIEPSRSRHSLIVEYVPAPGTGVAMFGLLVLSARRRRHW